MRRLPTVQELRTLVQTKTASAQAAGEYREKVACDTLYTTETASSLNKIAQKLKTLGDPEPTYSDVISFANRLMG